MPIHPPFLPIDLAVHPSVVAVHPPLMPTLHSESLGLDDQPVSYAGRFNRKLRIAEWSRLGSASETEDKCRSDKEPHKVQIRHSPLLDLAVAARTGTPLTLLRLHHALLDQMGRADRNAGAARLIASERPLQRNRRDRLDGRNGRKAEPPLAGGEPFSAFQPIRTFGGSGSNVRKGSISLKNSGSARSSTASRVFRRRSCS
ncbi:protein of unknown function [Methylorubrum extorquens]|uniref:Uncharacterized protein n=1 Tax=Methylorubrum extorquens TaxID=408 RepID=A0A2N9AXN9_METEX|nr:protein of unknown function [Methylorubrum extorquens]